MEFVLNAIKRKSLMFKSQKFFISNLRWNKRAERAVLLYMLTIFFKCGIILYDSQLLILSFVLPECGLSLPPKNFLRIIPNEYLILSS